MSKCGERIKEMREAHSWKVRDLAPMVGTSIASLSRWESGINMPKAKEIKAMAKIFNVNPVWLMGLDDVPKYVVNNTESKPIPVVGAIAAGQPITASEYIESYEYVEEGSSVDFCLRVRGDSMKNARIYDGDIVYVRKQSDVDSGEIAVVLINDEDATLKRVIKDENGIILMPENPEYLPMIFRKSGMKDVKILGKVIAVKFEV